MNSRKVRYSCFVVCLSVLLGSSWSAPAAAFEIPLKTQRVTLDGKHSTESVWFQVQGPGKVILEATALSPLNQMGLIVRGADPKVTALRKDGPTPLRLEFPVTAQTLANWSVPTKAAPAGAPPGASPPVTTAPQGYTWKVDTTIMGTNGMVYAIPGSAAVVDLRVSFVPDAPVQKTTLPPMKEGARWGGAAQPTSGMATGKSGPAQVTPGMATGKNGPPQVTSGMATGKAVPPIEPKWPQPFELGPGEQTGFGFVAGNPGLIVVNVRWTGVPLTVILAKPGGFFIYQQGNGSVTLQYNATADDVKKGVLWGVSLHPTQVAATPPVGSRITVIEKQVKIDTRGVAKGTITIQHPPGDMALAQAELKARTVKAQALKPTSQQVATANVNVLAQKQAALQKQQTVRQAALVEKFRSRIPAMSGIPLERKGEGKGTVPQIAVPKPVITSLSSTSGQPGDPVLLLGSGFSSVPGEVHFIVADGKDVVAQTNYWNDEAIVAIVPDVSGIWAFNGLIYVKRGASSSNPLAFRFEPSVEYRTLVMRNHGGATWNEFIEAGTDPVNGNGVVLHDYRVTIFSIIEGFTGARGDDQFYLNFPTHLKNGWTADSAYLSMPGNSGGIQIVGSADAYISEFTPGTATDVTILKVHWWADFGSAVWYSPYIVIKGPKGLPYQ